MDIETYVVGNLKLNDTVDITDPSYDKDVWCRMTVDCEPGLYSVYLVMDDKRIIHKLGIKKRWDGSDITEYLGSIGVDSARAGFFKDKPDYSSKEYHDMIDLINPRNGKKDKEQNPKLPYKTVDYWVFDEGAVSWSGHGDGYYPVFTNKQRDGFCIDFDKNNYEGEPPQPINQVANTELSESFRKVAHELFVKNKLQTAKEYFNKNKQSLED